MTSAPPAEARAERLRAMLADELQSAWLYDRLAQLARRPSTRATLRDLADAERRHARHWAERLGDPALAAAVVRPALRTRALALLARVAGVSMVLPQLRAAELADIRRYEEEPEAGNLAQDERDHRQRLGELGEKESVREAEHGLASTGLASAFRATLFGFNDGLVSNLSLVAGVAGAAVQSDAVLLAGVAGLLAGAFSMGAGEYVSVRSQRELFEYQIAKERAELELDPDEERGELLAIYEAKGLSRDVAGEVVSEIMRDSDTALETLAREELGLDPADLGSPWEAAIGSFTAFTLGAIIPVLPFIITRGYPALVAAVIAAGLALAATGMLTSLLTGRHPLFAAGRMLLIGGAATGVTFGIGSLVPISL